MLEQLKIICACSLFSIILIFNCTVFASEKITLSVKNIEINELIGLLARALHQNIIVSPNVRGYTSLSVENALAEQVLQLLLLNHGLGKIQQANVWFVAPREDLIKSHEEEAKLQLLKTDRQVLVSKIWRIKYANAEQLVNLLKESKNNFISTRGSINLDARTNSIVMQDHANKISVIDKMVKKLDVPVPRVMIAARIAALDHDFERELGLTVTQRIVLKDKSDQHGANNKPGNYNFTIAKLANNSSLDVKLSALENAGHAELISRPSLFTENQQTASIEAGEEVPYQEVSESGGTATVFKKAVLSLKVKPQVLPGNKVLLQLKINQDRPSGRFVLGVPIISTRQLSTSVLVKSGETVALGGIYETDRGDAQQGIPILNKIPLLGRLFGLYTTTRNKRELCIFVTPTVIATHEHG